MNPRFIDWWLAHPSLFGMPFHFWTGVLAILGAFIGSFLNVCIHRMPRDLSVVNPPSHCPFCNYRIPWGLNIPVITWLWLRGKCRSCQAPISPRYLAVELLTSAAFVIPWLTFGHGDPSASSSPRSSSPPSSTSNTSSSPTRSPSAVPSPASSCPVSPQVSTCPPPPPRPSSAA